MRFKKFVKLMDHTCGFNDLTNFECKEHAMTGNGSYVYMLKLTKYMEKLVKSRQVNFFWRVSAFWNHCATSRPPTTTPPPPPPRPPPCTASPSSSTYMEQNFSYCDQENLVVRRTLSCTMYYSCTALTLRTYLPSRPISLICYHFARVVYTCKSGQSFA